MSETNETTLSETELIVEKPVANWSADDDEQLVNSLAAIAGNHKLDYLLAHCDDGIIWGRFDRATKRWAFSGEFFPTFSPPFRHRTLQQCRAFGSSAELFVWREGSELRARLLVEPKEATETKAFPYFDRPQLLWGTVPDGDPQGGFTPLREGGQGMRHAVPLALPAGYKGRVALSVRHYIDYAEDHQAFVKFSRLVDLTV